MNTIECTTLAGSLMKTRGNFWILNQVTRRPKALVRLKHDPCEPAHISWQWLAKSSPDVQKCHQLTLKKKVCPKKRFLPRLRRGFIHKDILACEPEKKPLSWSEYFSFLLPDEITQKPPMATCRKLLEHRRRKCLAPEDYQRCVTGECWPLPTEWYGQGVMHISQLALTSPPRKAVEKIQHCPPPAHMLAKCSKVKLPECPTPKCSDESPRRMPYLQFRGADTDGSPPTLSVKCLVKHNPDLLPHPQNLDKSVKISCRNYGEFKAVDCPKQMFNRYMNVDFNTKNLLPIPTTSTEYTPLREVKKGVCERQTLLRPPSIRNFSTGRPLMLKDFPEFIKPANTNHLQPGSSAFRSEKLIERAGMDVDLLHKPLNERSSDGHRLYWFTEEELNKHELEAQRAEETTQEKQKRLDAQKSKLQVLVDKQNSEGAKNSDGKPVRAKGPNEEPGRRKLFGGMVDLEEVPYQRSGFHFSATQLARKSNDRTKGSKSSKNDDKICSGCPGIHGEEAEAAKVKTRCNVLKGGIRGRCKVERPPEPNGRPNRLTMKCKPQRDSPCMRPRSEPVLVGAPSRFFHADTIGRSRSLEQNGRMSYSNNPNDMLDRCCEQLEQLEKQIETLKSDLKTNRNNKQGKKAESKKAEDMLKLCCDQQEALKKQIEDLKKAKGENGQKSSRKSQEHNGDGGGANKSRSGDDPCSKDGAEQGNCKQIREKLQKKKFCLQHMEKENEKLKKELESMNNQNSQCEEQTKELKITEEKLKTLIQANEKLVAELKDMKQKIAKAGVNKCRKETTSQPPPKKMADMDPQMKQAFENCVKKCSEKVFKDRIKKDLQKEKKKCQDMLKQKKKNLEGSEDKVGKIINAACDKLHNMANKAKTKKNNKKC